MFTFPIHGGSLSSSSDVRSSLPIPMVYEAIPSQELSWEYHVLAVETKEEELPTIERLNELGAEGWVMVSVLDERSTGKGSRIYYYFVRQPRESKTEA